jgi:hypothetical protein
MDPNYHDGPNFRKMKLGTGDRRFGLARSNLNKLTKEEMAVSLFRN